jgi:hypothetical protein
MEYNAYTYRTILFLFIVFFLCINALAQSPAIPDTTIIFTPSNPNLIQPQSYRPMTKAWGLDLLLSNNGFGLGMFYRYELSDELSMMLNFAVSDVKDETEFEQYDYLWKQLRSGKEEPASDDAADGKRTVPIIQR